MTFSTITGQSSFIKIAPVANLQHQDALGFHPEQDAVITRTNTVMPSQVASQGFGAAHFGSLPPPLEYPQNPVLNGSRELVNPRLGGFCDPNVHPPCMILPRAAPGNGCRAKRWEAGGLSREWRGGAGWQPGRPRHVAFSLLTFNSRPTPSRPLLLTYPSRPPSSHPPGGLTAPSIAPRLPGRIVNKIDCDAWVYARRPLPARRRPPWKWMLYRTRLLMIHSRGQRASGPEKRRDAASALANGTL